uniref:L-amino-acid oxidase n=1 Tax=Plectus sambesii TaxID=2011161 RepID=A0A914VJM9_9BILA
NIFHLTAIVGGGIGGTSCAYWLQKAAGDSIDIDLFNYGKIGGRIATANVNGKRFEAGASILHPENKYMAQWTEEFG